LVGSEGIALTTLRPAGSADFNGKRVDVVADWEYIEKGSRIKVLRVEGVKVVVKKVIEETAG
jgi:membrane-bound serine protease (ClpP class)